MLFNSGTPSLIGYTRFLVNDPTTAASQMFSAQEVKDAINDAYQVLVDEGRLQETGVVLHHSCRPIVLFPSQRLHEDDYR
jgi:hypothetical protein